MSAPASFCTACGQTLSVAGATAPGTSTTDHTQPASPMICGQCGNRVHAHCTSGGLCTTCAASPALVVQNTAPMPTPAKTCPRCQAPATPSLIGQTCSVCSGKFLLLPGARGDASVHAPPMQASSKAVRVKWSNLLTYKAGVADVGGVSAGTLDPVLGTVPLDTSGVGYPDIYSIAVWRKLDVLRVVALTVFILPIVLLLMIGSVESPGLLIIGLPLLLLYVWQMHRGIKVGQHWMRVVGHPRTLEIRFDMGLMGGKRKRFYQAVVRRAGHEPPAIP